MVLLELEVLCELLAPQPPAQTQTAPFKYKQNYATFLLTFQNFFRYKFCIQCSGMSDTTL